MSISLEQIKSLRDRTGVSISICKEALVAANGDEEKAIEFLRKKGEAKAAKRSENETANGAVAIVNKDGKAAMVALACETDFVARNDDFLKSANDFAEKLLTEGADADLEEDVKELSLRMGEKVVLHNKTVVEAPLVGAYTHLNNRIGVLVGLTGGDSEMATKLAMHVAATNPLNISPDDVDDATVEKERSIWLEQLQSEGKPENIIEKIMEGKEKKFRGESALLTQAFVMNPEQTIAEFVGDFDVNSFFRFEV